VEAGSGAVRLESWTGRWLLSFTEEARRLDGAFADVGASIEHIGSTSVRGLVAKPIIDVLVGVTDLSDVEVRVGAMEAIGYEYVAAYESEIPDRRYFRRPRARPRTFHVHCVERAGRLWSRHLAFRDHLRAHPTSAAEYGALKQELAGRHSGDRAAYQAGKASFIEGVLTAEGVS
jgi:GrpB-like predicted nucleotidyltransferase (UPF0157 family)